MNNVLVIGGTGFIGSNIVKQLIDKEYNVFLLEQPDSDISILGHNKKNVVLSYGRLDQYDLIKDLLQKNSINLVIHLASTLIPSSLIDEYLNEFDAIIKPTIKLLPFLSEINVKLVYFSSGGTIYGNVKNTPYSELDETLPISYYGQSKLIIEESIKLENRKSGLKFLIIRPSNPYGSGQRLSGKQGLIATSIGHILNNEKITIWGDGSIVRDYIYIDDLIFKTLQIIQSGKDNEIYNIGNGKGYSVNQILHILSRCIGRRVEVEYQDPWAVDVSTQVLDTYKYNYSFDIVNTPL